MSTTTESVVAVLIVFVAYGLVGRMDYEDAVRMTQARADEEVRLLCWRSRAGPVQSEAPAVSTPVVRATYPIDGDPAVPGAQVLRCVLLDE